VVNESNMAMLNLSHFHGVKNMKQNWYTSCLQDIFTDMNGKILFFLWSLTACDVPFSNVLVFLHLVTTLFCGNNCFFNFYSL